MRLSLRVALAGVAALLLVSTARAADDEGSEGFLERLGIGDDAEGKTDDRVILYEGHNKVVDKPALTLLLGLEGPLFSLQAFATASVGIDLDRWLAFDFAVSTGQHDEDLHQEKRREARGQTYALTALVRPLASRGGLLAGFFLRAGPALQRTFVEKCLANCKKLADQTDAEYQKNLEITGWSTSTFGVEAGLGYRHRFGEKNRWMWEFLPATLFVPERRIYTHGAPPSDARRSERDDVVSPRYIVWRIGLVR